MSAAVDVEISIVTMNHDELLRACLRTLPEACAGVSRHLTVVDNARGGATRAVVREVAPDARLIENAAPLGFGANHNQAIRHVLAERSARYVLVLNDDTELEPGSVAALVRACDDDPNVGIAGALLLNPDRTHQPAAFRFPSLRSETFSASLLPERLRAGLWPRLVEVVPPRDRVTHVDWVLGAAMLVRVAALEEAGSFDERYFLYSEELDLARRFAARGFACATVPDATIVHLGGQSIQSSFPRAAGRSRWLYVRTHWSPLRVAVLALLLAVVYAWNTVYVLARVALSPRTARPKLRQWRAHWHARPLP